MSVNTLGVKINIVDSKEAQMVARGFLVSEKQHTIFTPNPEMLVKAQKDMYFKQILNNSNLNLCDGFGIALVNFLAGKIIPRVTGVDFFMDLCQMAEEEGRSVFLLGSGSDEVVKQTAVKLLERFPNLKIAAVHKGIVIDESRIMNQELRSCDTTVLVLNEVENQALVDSINVTKPDILFVAFGMGKQEKWIYENLHKLPTVKVAMGVGGAFDFVSGKIPRAPCFLRKIGLEWVYRLLKQPRRFGRIFNATVKFCFIFYFK